MVSPLESHLDVYAGMNSGERQIASVLDAYRIPYEYERPVLVQDQDKQRIWYPDFTLEPYGTLIEYFGIVNDPDYERGIRRRLDTYAANYLDVIDMYPSSFSPGWDERLLSRVEHVLESHLYRWRNQTQPKSPPETQTYNLNPSYHPPKSCSHYSNRPY